MGRKALRKKKRGDLRGDIEVLCLWNMKIRATRMQKAATGALMGGGKESLAALLDN